MGTMKSVKWYKPVLALIALIVTIMALSSPSAFDCLLAQNLPTQVEALRGKTWTGSECCQWQFTFTQKSGPIFRAKWWHPSGQQMTDDNITINIRDDNVEIIRAGGTSAGGCTYQGKIRVGFASGKYWCNGRYAGTWSATIRG